jgi:hypothetical protein
MSQTSTETVGVLFNDIVGFFSHRNVHKLAGTALASFGLVVSNVKDLSIGAAYAAIMHVVGGLKKVPDGS